MRKLLFILGLFFMVGCNQNKEVGKIDFEIISKGILSGAGEEGIEMGNLVIQDSNNWRQLVEKMNKINNVSDSFNELNIDFSKSSIVAVFDKIQTSGGHDLDLEIISDKNKVTVLVKKSKYDGMAISVMNQPYVILKIEKTKAEIVFETVN